MESRPPTDDRTERARRWVAQLSALRVGALVDANALTAFLLQMLSADAMELWQRELLTPWLTRLPTLLRARRERIERWLPAPAQQWLTFRLGQPAQVPEPVIAELADSVALREALKEEFLSLLTSLTSLTPPNGSSGFRGVMGRGASFVAAAGRGLLGAALPSKLPDWMAEAVDAGVASLQQRLVARLRTPAAARALGEFRLHLYRALLPQPDAVVGEALAALPVATLGDLLGPFVAHNLERDDVRAGLKEDVRWFHALWADRTVGELLDRTGTRSLLIGWLAQSPLLELLASAS